MAAITVVVKRRCDPDALTLPAQEAVGDNNDRDLAFQCVNALLDRGR